jgi:hypothetical protein
MDGFKKMHKSMIEFFSFFDKIPNWLRWILLIPTFLITIVVIAFIIGFGALISSNLSFQWFIVFLFYSFSVSGAIIITVIMAPKYRVVVGIVLVAIMCVLLGLSSIIIDSGAYTSERLGITIGAIVAFLYVIYGVKPYIDVESSSKKGIITMRLAGIIFFISCGLLSAIIGFYASAIVSIVFAVGLYMNLIGFIQGLLFLVIFTSYFFLTDPVDLPFWADYLFILMVSSIILFISKRTVMLASLIVQVIFPFLSIAVHIFTIIFVAINVGWWKSIITAFLPGFAQIYWAIIEWQNTGFRESYFIIVLLWYIFILILKYILQFYGIYLSSQDKKQDSGG